MPIPTVCPSCGARLSAAAGVAGRPASCPECRTPLAADPPDDGGFEVIDSPPPVRARAKVVAVRPADSVLPASAKNPTRPRDEEDGDDDDERPRSRAKSVKSAKVSKKPFLIAGGAVVLFGLLAACGGGYWVFGESILHPAPSGWTTASDSEGRYRVFMPGKATSAEQSSRNAVAHGHKYSPPPFPEHHSFDQLGNRQFKIESRPMLAGVAVPATPEDLLKLSGSTAGTGVTREVLVAVQLAGRPGAELRTYANINAMDNAPPFTFPAPDSFSPAEKQRFEAENRKKLADHAVGQPERDRKAQAGRVTSQHTVRYVVATESRLYIIEVTSHGAYPDEGLLKILRDSFVIR